MKAYIEKAGILIEALSYIQSFQDKIVVVKLGGSAMTTPGCAESVLRDVVFMEAVKMKPVLIHGGGHAISREMREAGISPQFIEGLRVSDQAVMKVVKKVLAGVNKELVEQIAEMGGRAEGLDGVKKSVVKARRHRPVLTGPDGSEKPTDIGYVGEVSSVARAKITRITDRETVPVIAPLGQDQEGVVHNINGDMMAGEIAAALKAEKLVFLTDVEGIMRKPQQEEGPQLLSSLKESDIQSLLKEGVIGGGMIPKVRAGMEALRKGVKKIHIIDGRIKHSLLLEIFTDKGIGTEITK